MWEGPKLMKTAALFAVAVSLAVGSSAFAAERAPAPPSHTPACMTLDKLKIAIKGGKFTPLNVSQFHFMMGAYAATPPIGLPADTDNALLVQVKDKSVIVWMNAECASKTAPMPIGDKFLAIVKSISPTAGETSDGADSKDDLHL